MKLEIILNTFDNELWVLKDNKPIKTFHIDEWREEKMPLDLEHLINDVLEEEYRKKRI